MTRGAAILKPTAVGCRPGMSSLGNKAICDEMRTLSDLLPRLEHIVSFTPPIKHVSNRLRSSFQVDGDGLSWPTPTALGGVGIGPRRWRAGGSRAMGPPARRTRNAARDATWAVADVSRALLSAQAQFCIRESR